MCSWPPVSSGLTNAGLLGVAREDLSDDAEMADGLPVDGAVPILDFEQRVDERAALVVGTPEPRVEGVEDGERTLLRAGGAAIGFGLEPSVRPALRAPLQKRDHERLLGRKVVIERRLGDVGLGDHPVDPDGMDAVAREQVI